MSKTVKLAGKAGYGGYTPETEAHYRSQLGFSARDIVENVPYSMVVHKVNDEGTLLFASSKLANLLGCETVYELMRQSGGSFKGIVHPDDGERVHARFASLEKSIVDDRDAIEFRVLTATGGEIDVRMIAKLVDIEDVGKVFYTLLSPVSS